MSDTSTEIKESVKDYIVAKLNSPFYTTFIISWCLWNWKIFYITIFIDSQLLLQEKGFLKIDYLTSFYSWTNHFWFTILHLVALPFLSAFFILYVISWITYLFLEESLNIRNKNEMIILKKDADLLKAKSKNLDIEQDIIEKKNVIEKSKPNEERWDEEYKEFRFSGYFEYFKTIESAIYENGVYLRNVGTQFKSYYDLNEIIEIHETTTDFVRISLTLKGRHFLKLAKQEWSTKVSDLESS